MENNELIPVYHFCVVHQVEISFIDVLQQYGLVEVMKIDDNSYLKESQLADAERYVRMHYDLDINIEGIEAIRHLLEKLDQVQQQNRSLQNRLGRYESPAEAPSYGA